MSSITLDRDVTAGVPTRGGFLGRFWPGLSGLLVVAGLVAMFVSPAGEDTGERPGEVVAFAADKEGWIVAAAIFAAAAVALLASFVAGLYGAVHGAASSTESASLVLGGAALAVLFPLALIVWFAPLLDVPADPARATAQAEAYLALDDVGWVMLGGAGVAAAVLAVTASRVAMRGGLIPAWLGWIGVLLGAASLATLAFFGLFAWLAWIAGASVLLLIGRR